MYYYYYNPERGGLYIDTKTLEYTNKTAKEIQSYVKNGVPVVNVVWEDGWTAKRFVKGYNKDFFRYVSENLIIIQNEKYEFLWCEGVLYKLLDGDKIICVFKQDSDYILVMLLNNFSTVSFRHTEFERVSECDRKGIKRNLLLM